MLTVNLDKLSPFFSETERDAILAAHVPNLAAAQIALLEGTGAGGEFTGWVHLPARCDASEFTRVKAAASKIRSDSAVLVVIGIGGSYLGARAVIELLASPNYNLTPGNLQIFFAGNSLSPDALNELIDLIGGRDFSVNVISKSGTTTEPAIAFRIFKSLLEEKYGKQGAKGRIYATTDKAKGALKALADAEGYAQFVVPDEIGGRYSVLTAVGLLPIAAAGIDIDALMDGARRGMERMAVPGADNPAWQYAAARSALYTRGKKTELLACYEPSFRFFAEWWKQLYGESEGKNGLGIFPASVEFTADLHSMGQYIQDGERTLFETVVAIRVAKTARAIPYDPDNADGLNFLAGLDLNAVNVKAAQGTLLAHVDGGVPNLGITVDARDPVSVGELIYFFEFSCGLSGYLLGVNPFDQPGVEDYKKNMFALLGKPGFEVRRMELMHRL